MVMQMPDTIQRGDNPAWIWLVIEGAVVQHSGMLPRHWIERCKESYAIATGQPIDLELIAEIRELPLNAKLNHCDALIVDANRHHMQVIPG
jgi:hypothetical protein